MGCYDHSCAVPLLLTLLSEISHRKVSRVLTAKVKGQRICTAVVMMSPSEMEKEEEAEAADHHSMFHLWGYKNPFAAILILTLIIGTPLSINKWWHLRVSSNRSGRGVIRLIQGISKRPFQVA